MGVTTGYGRLPLLALVWIFVIWAIGAGVYADLDHEHAMRPNSPVILRSPEWVLCARARRQPGHAAFARAGKGGPGAAGRGAARLLPPPARSLGLSEVQRGHAVGRCDRAGSGQRPEGLLVARHAQRRIGYAGKWFMYFQTVAGLALGLLAVAGFSGIVKSN